MEDHTDKQQFLQKLKSLLSEAEGSTSLEAIGKAVLLEQMNALTGLLYTDIQEKLPAIFVGLPHERFVELLEQADNAQLQNIKKLAACEALQHHLTILGHDFEQQTHDKEAVIENLTGEIATLNTAEMGKEDIHLMELKIDSAIEDTRRLINTNSKALAIAWNTPRQDLIETFSHTKERLESLLNRGFGARTKDNRPATGLYAALEKHIFHIYTQGDAYEGVKDEEPAIEGLAKFSIWYPKDYWEIGLLPEFANTGEAANSQLHEQHNQDGLFLQVSENLKRLGLSTLLDLKKARIFSKKSLHEYIKERTAK